MFTVYLLQAGSVEDNLKNNAIKKDELVNPS